MTDKKLSELAVGSVVDARDLFYSVPQAGGQVKQNARGLRAYVRPQSLSVDDPTYGVVTGTVGGAQRIANVTGINACIAAAVLAGRDVDFGPYTYQIDGTIVVRPAANNTMPTLRGVAAVTRIEQCNSAGGIDTIQFGCAPGGPYTPSPYRGGILDLWIVSITNQSTTTPLTGHLGAQIAICNVNQSVFAGITIGEYNQRITDNTHFCYNGIAMDSNAGAYSSSFHDIEIKGYGNQGFIEYGTSGNYHYNIMIRNSGLGEPTFLVQTGSAMQIFNDEGVFDQINIEWTQFTNAQPAMYIPSAAGVRFGHLHMEGLQLSQSYAGARAGFILFGGAEMVRFESIHMISTNLPTGCNIASAALFSFGFSSSYYNISVGQLLISLTSTLGTGVNWYLVNTYEGSGAGTVTNAQIDFVGPFLFFGDGTFASKLTGWSDCNFASTNRGPANGLGVPPSNLVNGSTYSITTGSPGYSAGVYTQTNYDGIATYIWTAAVNGTINMAQTIDPLLPVSTPMFPGVRRRIVNGSAANTVAVHNADTTNILTAASLSAGQWVDIVFDDITGKWIEIAAGTRL